MRLVWRYVDWRVVLICIILTVTVYKLMDSPDASRFTIDFNLASSPLVGQNRTDCLHELPTPLWQQTLEFDELQISNETGHPSRCYLVPNFIHFVHFGGNPFRYDYMICVLAAFKNQKPDKIYFHYDNNATFTGKYWEVLLQTPGFKEVMILHEIQMPVEIYGQPLSKDWRIWHASDITRIQMVMKYGGIFLDNDCYLIKSVDSYRGFEITMNWDENQYLGSQVIIAHKDARFLKKWLECYKVYDKRKWYYNAGERPTIEVLYKHPELIHRVKVLFGADYDFRHYIYEQRWTGWKDLYILHLLNRHQPVEFDESNIAYHNVTFRDMAYDVYDIANIKWPKAEFS